MSFSEYLKQAESGSVIFDRSWAQGRAGFGGLVAALLYQNMNSLIRDDRPLRSLQIGFVGPVVAEEEFFLESEVLREGKSVTQIQGRGLQSENVQLSMLGAFGHSRESSISVIRPSVIFPENPEEQKSLDGLGGLVPSFTQHFDFRYITALPFAGSDDTCIRGFLKFSRSPSVIGIPELIALIDAWPPTPLPMMRKLAPASSLSWSVEFMDPMPELGPEEYCQYEATIQHAENGYGHTLAKIWNRKGELLAISQQTVTIFG